MAGLQFDWIGYDETILLYVNQVTTESKPVKLETSCTVKLHPTVSVLCAHLRASRVRDFVMIAPASSLLPMMLVHVKPEIAARLAAVATLVALERLLVVVRLLQ